MTFLAETQVATPYTLAQAFATGNRYFSLAPTNPWLGKDREQQEGIARQLAAILQEVPILNRTDFRTIATPDIEAANRALKSEGFDCQLTPIPLDSIALVAIMKLLGHWIFPGKSKPVYSQLDDSVYPGALIKNGVEIKEIPDLEHPIAILHTREGFDVLISVREPGPIPFGLSLEEFGAHLNGKGRVCRGFSGVHFPQINLNMMRNYDHVLGLYTLDNRGARWSVSQATGQTILKVNHCGFLAKDAVAMQVSRGISSDSNPLVIDKPFVLAVFRSDQQTKYPLLTAYLNRDVWKSADLA